MFHYLRVGSASIWAGLLAWARWQAYRFLVRCSVANCRHYFTKPDCLTLSGWHGQVHAHLTASEVGSSVGMIH